MYLWSMLTHHWQVFDQYENGMIDQKVFEAYVTRLQIILNTPLSRGMWRTRMRKTFPSDFQKFIDTQIEEEAWQVAVPAESVTRLAVAAHTPDTAAIDLNR